MKLQLGLEWFLSPDHLPLIAGIELGWYRVAGLELELVVPDDHYDGLAATVGGAIAFSCNEPLHMVDAPRPGLASPVAGGVTDAIAIEILARWSRHQGGAFSASQVSI